MKKLTITFIILDILVAIGFFVTYSPVFEDLQNTIISTAINTKTHDYIAYIFYSEEHVNKVVSMSSFTPIEASPILPEAFIFGAMPKDILPAFNVL